MKAKEKVLLFKNAIIKLRQAEPDKDWVDERWQYDKAIHHLEELVANVGKWEYERGEGQCKDCKLAPSLAESMAWKLGAYCTEHKKVVPKDYKFVPDDALEEECKREKEQEWRVKKQ